MTHRSLADLDARLDAVRSAPADAGAVVLLVRRPAPREREELHEAELDPGAGLVGDGWRTRPSKTSPDGGPHPEKELTLMSRAALEAVAGERPRWSLAGDQVIVELDLSETNLPAGTRLALGEAEVEISATPHTGCAAFAERFGRDALRWVNSRAGRALRLRGVNARVVRGGSVRVGDVARKLG
jgi:MOSC domain-containing protein YiiM